MSLFSLLKKELQWSRRNLLLLVFLLVLLPGFFAGTSVAFQEVLPRDVPVAVVAENDQVGEEELTIVKGGLTVFTDPAVVETTSGAERMLDREAVYAIVEVPPDITESGVDATFTLTVDGSIVPFLEPSDVIGSLMRFQLDETLPADVSVDRTVVGDELELPEYLFPTVLMSLVIFVGFTYVPYDLSREAAVLDRLRVEASLEAVVLSKLLYTTVLMLVPVFVFHVAALYFGYDVHSLAPGALLAFATTFLLVSTVSTTIMVLTRFSVVGRFLNVVLMLAVLGLSGLAFPVGFFSTIRTTIVRILPTHYAMIIARSMMLKDVGLTAFADWIGILVGLVLAGGLALQLVIVRYRRVT